MRVGAKLAALGTEMCINGVSTVAECALPTLPYTLESCTAVSIEGSVLIFEGCRQDACALSCGSSVLWPRDFGLNLARSPNVVPF